MEVRHVITGAEPIEHQEAAEEHRSSEVLRRKPPSTGHMSVHDWQGIEIVVNMEGP
jgi:hypothetical protein